MASHASALKAHRQSLKRNIRNRKHRSHLRTGLKKFELLLTEQKAQQAGESLGGLYSLVDKAVRKGALSKNAAARQKSRLSRHANRLVAPAAKV